MSENEANSLFPFVFSGLMAILGLFSRKERALVEGSRIVTNDATLNNNRFRVKIQKPYGKKAPFTNSAECTRTNPKESKAKPT